MKAALTKRLDATGADLRSLLRDKNIRHAGISREGRTSWSEFRDAATRDKAQATSSPAHQPDLRADRQPGRRATSSSPARSSRRRRSAPRNSPSSRTSPPCTTASTNSASPSRSSSSRAPTASWCSCPACRTRPRPRTSSAAPRRWKCAWWTKSADPARWRRPLQGQVPFGTELYIERGGAPLLVKKQVVLTGDRLTDAQPGFDNQTQEPAVHRHLDAAGARIFKRRDARERRQAHGHPADREGQGRGGHRAGDPHRDRRRPRADHRPHDQHRGGQRRSRCCCAPARWPRRWRSSRSAPSAPASAPRTSRRASIRRCTASPRSRVFMIVYYLLFGFISVLALARQPAVPGRPAVDAAGDADPAGHRRHRADAGHGDRRQRADQRAHPRGTAQRQHAAGGDPRRLRARLGHHSRLQHHHADRRPRAVDLRFRPGARLRRGASAWAS